MNHLYYNRAIIVYITILYNEMKHNNVIILSHYIILLFITLYNNCVINIIYLYLIDSIMFYILRNNLYNDYHVIIV
jgi:hypothetical protein